MSFFADESGARQHKIRLPLPQAEVWYYPHWLSAEQASDYQQALMDQLPWRQDDITLFGKTMKIPRLQSWHGDPGCTYGYSGMRLAPQPWGSVLNSLRDQCQNTLGARFNSVLANWYRDGSDSMSLHADDEPELGVDPVIASVTFGEARPFVFRHKQTKDRYTQVLAHGSLLVMAAGTQAHYLHGIAKTKKPVADRINLTFRYLHLQESTHG